MGTRIQYQRQYQYRPAGEKTGSGDNISAGAGAFGAPFGSAASFSGLLGVQLRSYCSRYTLGWHPFKKGLAEFSFTTNTTNGATQTDYGWVRLLYKDGSNGIPGSVTAIDWAYDATGAAITAGEGAPSSAPETSTGALAFLAVGAAGIIALRRRPVAE